MKKHYGIVLSMLMCIPMYAESIKGIVYEKKENIEIPLVGVNIYWAETTLGTITNNKGYFKLEQPNNSYKHLVFSYVGYQNDTIMVSDDNPVTIYLTQGEAIGEVTVIHRTKSTSISKLNPLFVQKVSQKELERCACCNLSESFETNASVDVAYADAVSGVKQIQLLGLSGRYSQLTVGNIPSLRGAESAFGLEYFPGTWLNGLQISKGTATVKNGYESITGQINIDLKEPNDMEKLHFYTYGNQDGKVESTFGYAINLNEKWSTSLMIQGSGNFRELDLNEDGFLDKPIARMGTFMNQWNYKSASLNSKFGLSYLKEERQGGQLGYDHDKPQKDQLLYGINIDVERFNVYAKNGLIFHKEATSLGLIVSYNYFDRKSYYGFNTYDVTQQNLYTNLIYQSFLGDTRHTYNLGISAVYDDNNATFNENKENVGFNEFTPGVFAEYTYMPNEKITFLAGLRYDYSNIHGNFITPRVHAKYSLTSKTTVRASAGKGYRTADAVSENSNLLASSKRFIFDENIKQEEAWNYGISLVNEIPLGKRSLNLNMEYYRTDFTHQLVVDMEQSTQQVHFYNLNGNSYSNIFQIEGSYELFNRFDLNAAYRYNEVKTTYNATLTEAPFINRYKGLLSASYSTNQNKWQFNFTAQFNGDQRLPSTKGNTPENSRPSRSESYTVFLAQITKNYRNWSFYFGGENLGNFTQNNAIIAPDDPFGNQFDASRIWGPLYGEMVYVGIKYILNKE